jgi:putative addiction module killer protein
MLEKNKNRIHRTSEFDRWLRGVTNAQGKMAILNRLDRAQKGYFGDCESVGSGVSEIRVFVGPGYRLYYARTGTTDYTMLTGSDKTDQTRGIRRAKQILDAMRGK